MRVTVDPERCGGRGLCVRHAPEVFEFDEHHRAVVIDWQPAEAMRERVEDAMYDCPTRAISIAG